MSRRDEEHRLRTPPAERFAGPSHLFSLRSLLEQLRGEDHPARDGHRQMTLIHRGAVTQVLFAFDEGGFLDSHSAHGLVTLHVVEGRLRVDVSGRDHELSAGQLLVLDPDVPHGIRASERSAMVLTVHLDKD